METTTEDLTVVVENDSFTTDLAKRFLLGAATTVGGIVAGVAAERVKTVLKDRKARKATEETTETE